MQPDEKSYCAIRTPELCGIALKNVTIGNGTEEVGGFDNCPNLKSLVLPESVKYYTAGKGTANGNYNGIRNLTVNNRNCIVSGIDSLAEGITITAYCGSPAHKAAVKRNAHFVSLGHEYLDWYTVTPASKTAEGTERRDCAYCDHYEERTIPMLRDETHKATFVADGQVVSVVEFTDTMTSIEEPPVPAKDRYLGEWEDYTLGDEDITVNAVYTLIKAEDAEDIQTDSIAELYDKTDDVLFTVKASSAAKTVKSTISQSIPLDIVLVADQSGSMADSLGGTQTKVEALKEAAAGFVAQVSANAKATGADHRIAIAGFGLAGNYTGYQQNENTELLTTASGVPIVYHNIKPSDYAGALLPVLSGSSTNPSVTAAVNAIDARGATAADLGLEMAKSIFANTDSSGRQRVVVFMTDGEPTYSSSFQTSVANSAIANARVLKNTYDATVYSIGVFDDTQAGNKNIQAFMNAVSSDHPNAVSLKNLGQKQSEHFFMTVGHTDALSNVFRTITTESLSHTAAFDKLTLIKTLSKYVTLTATQEQALRVSLIRRYGITNDQITVVRRDNGTTEIKVTGLTPYEVTAADGSVSYEVSVSFFASLNELAVTEGDYAVDTEDSGIMLGDGARGYEATFTPSVVTLSGSVKRFIFTINNEVYDITEGTSPTAAKPETDFPADWQFSGWDTGSAPNANGTVINATLVKAIRTVTWHTDDGDIVQTYAEGAIITPPEAGDKADGSKFLSWNRSIPTVMPDSDLTFTAIYGDHVHQYSSEVITPVSCTVDGVIRYTCCCGDSHDETVSATGHSFEAVTPSQDNDASHCTFVCSHCGLRYDYALTYQVTTPSLFGWNYISYEFNLTDDDLDTGFEPDGTIYIRIPLSELQSNAKNARVTRMENGRKINVDSRIEDDYLIIEADHFSPYEIVLGDGSASNQIGDVNGDGVIDICDVTAIQRHTADIEPFREVQLALADTNGDAVVSIKDGTHLQKYLAQYDVVLGRQ